MEPAKGTRPYGVPGPSAVDARHASDDPLDPVSVMDAIDEARRQQHLLARESGLAGEDDLVARVMETYRRMGTPVTEAAVQDTVRAMRGERLAHRPMPRGPLRWLALAYIRRRRAYAGAAALAALALAWEGGERVLVEWPSERARAETEQGRSAIAADLRSTLDLILETSPGADDAAASRRTVEEGERALAAGDAATARARLADARSALAEFRSVFAVTVVSRQEERYSVVYRTPRDNPNARAYYAIVEALGPDGQALPRAVHDIETGRTVTVRRWGQRITKQLYDAIAMDKQADGHVDDAVLGTKLRGTRSVTWRDGQMEGAVTRW